MAAREAASDAGTDGDAGKPDPGSFAVRLNELFNTHLDSNGRRLTTEAIAARCADLGTPISRAYLFHLRRGGRTNPSPEKVEALAAAFGVTRSYFYRQDEDASVEVDEAIRIAMADARVRNIALRAAQLSPEVAVVLDGLLANLERLPQALRSASTSISDSDG